MRGARIGITAARRAEEQAAIVRSLGGHPLHGPSIDLDRPAPDGQVAAALASALDSPLDIAIFLTGVGASRLVGVATRAGLDDALRAALESAQVVVRGTKPRRVLRELGIRVDWAADPPESRAIRDALLSQPMIGRRIMIQCAGPEADPMIGPLREAGARVISVHPYDIETPPDINAAVALASHAAAGDLEALTFTSAQAAHGFVGLAERAGVGVAALVRSPALVAAVGPVTRDALRSHGVRVDVEPRTPRMGAMFQALAVRLADERASRG